MLIPVKLPSSTKGWGHLRTGCTELLKQNIKTCFNSFFVSFVNKIFVRIKLIPMNLLSNLTPAWSLVLTPAEPACFPPLLLSGGDQSRS